MKKFPSLSFSTSVRDSHLAEMRRHRWHQLTRQRCTQTHACNPQQHTHTHTHALALIFPQRLCALQRLEHIYLLPTFSASHHHLPSLCSWRKGERSKYLYHFAAADGTEHKIGGWEGSSGGACVCYWCQHAVPVTAAVWHYESQMFEHCWSWRRPRLGLVSVKREEETVRSTTWTKLTYRKWKQLISDLFTHYICRLIIKM